MRSLSNEKKKNRNKQTNKLTEWESILVLD
jgi:hypothetical protein